MHSVPQSAEPIMAVGRPQDRTLLDDFFPIRFDSQEMAWVLEVPSEEPEIDFIWSAAKRTYRVEVQVGEVANSLIWLANGFVRGVRHVQGGRQANGRSSGSQLHLLCDRSGRRSCILQAWRGGGQPPHHLGLPAQGLALVLHGHAGVAEGRQIPPAAVFGFRAFSRHLRGVCPTASRDAAWRAATCGRTAPVTRLVSRAA